MRADLRITATAACAAARLGVDVAYWGQLGVDEVGDRIVERLSRCGVKTDGVVRVEGRRGPMGIILVDQGENTPLLVSFAAISAMKPIG